MSMPCKTTRLPGRDVRYACSRNDRIRKLLLSEYRELSEAILVESPFAETTRNGRGLRQVTLGLTPTRLIVAADILHANPGFFCPVGVDVSVESFELISVYPLEYVALSVFRRRYCKTLKARFVDGRARYYELGGARRGAFWKIWVEQVQRLSASKTDGSSLSETTAASESSSSTLYLLSSRIEVRDDDRDTKCRKPAFRVWTHYGGAGDYVAPTWIAKDLYLGPSFNELTDGHYTPVPIRFAGASLEEVKYELESRTPRYVACKKSCHSWPCQKQPGSQAKSQRAGGFCKVLFARNREARCYGFVASCKSSSCNICQLDDSVGISIPERHSRYHVRHGMLSEEEFREYVEKKYDVERQRQRREGSRAVLASKVSRFGFGVPEKCYSGLILGPCRGDPRYVDELACHPAQPRDLIESGVTVWEDRRGSSKNQRHPRRYAFSSAAHFLHALGPWSVQPGERESVQTLRSSSTVNIRRQPSDPELRLPVSRRQLTASVSCTALTSGGSNIVSAVARGRVTLFWTPEYWYRPQAAVAAYRELRYHLASLRDFRRGKEKQTKKKFFYRLRSQTSQDESGNSRTMIAAKSSSLLERVLSINGARKQRRRTREDADADRGMPQLRRLLRMNLRITAWDLDSGTLAAQLTMIDRDLFVRIPVTEIEVLIYQRSSRNAPNLGAWIAFSHRIACLTVSEILAVKKLDMRTRIMARFINVADKCFALGNFQSCRSVLAGLQAPPVYRLRKSWSYLRTHHPGRYEMMEKLSKIYKSPLCPKYRRAWAVAKRSPPYMPYVDHLLVKVLSFNSTENVQMNVASRSKKRSTVQIVNASGFSRINNNSDNYSRDGQNLMEPKRCLARRFLMATLDRIKFATRQNIAKGNGIWTYRQRYLARKFFYRWNVIVLESRMRAENEKRSKSMDPRRKRVLEMAAWLTDCQRFAQSYSFPLHSFAHEFLLKARYREDRDNFFISLKLEPSRLI